MVIVLSFVDEMTVKVVRNLEEGWCIERRSINRGMYKVVKGKESMLFYIHVEEWKRRYEEHDDE